jgi:nicotinamidase-related amidase
MAGEGGGMDKGFNAAAAMKAVMLLKAANDNNGSDLAVLVIDVQRQFCDPEHEEGRGNQETVEASERIAAAIPKFRSAGIPVYAVYFDTTMNRHPDLVDWYKFRPAYSDTMVPKNNMSAFKSSCIEELLLEKGHKTLLACGFNRSACVAETLIDARSRGFNVIVLPDLTGNDRVNKVRTEEDDMEMFADMGINILDSGTALQNIPCAFVRIPG